MGKLNLKVGRVMKVGSKYYPLYEYLRAGARDRLTLTFIDIEQLIQTPLPASASKRAWWSNRDSASALQAAAWVRAGYHVEAVDFNKQTVTFGKFKAEYTIQRQGDAILWNQDAIRALRKYMKLTQAKFAQELGVRRQTVSEWENGVYEPDRSTAKHLERIAEQRGFES
ncbi:MAG: helix-turn-helix transcriptional regulator [Phormidesmis sp.]